MKLRQLAVFLGGYVATVVALARLYHSFSGTTSPVLIATCLAIALLIGFAAGTSETVARHGTTFTLAAFCGALTILLSFCMGRAGVAVTALPYVFFWTNAACVGLQAARMCRTALNTGSAVSRHSKAGAVSQSTMAAGAAESPPRRGSAQRSLTACGGNAADRTAPARRRRP